MINELTTLIRLAGEAVLRIVTWPGEQVLAYVADLIPGLVETLTLHPGNSPLLYAVSLTAWLLLFLFVRGVVRFVHNVLRVIERIKTYIRFRMSMAMRFGKRRVDGLSRAFRIWRHPEEAETPHIEFDDQDIVVLDAIVARGPGFAVSAPELTEQLELRPSQVQRSLDKLCESALLQPVIGSTDGYDNYGVTPIGQAFLQSWLRQTSPKNVPRPKPQIKEPKPDREYIPDGLHLSG
jgi:DNA-binding MarR family transcriptional regulator